MADNSFKIKNSLVLTPVDLATLTNPQAGDLACDSNDSNKIKRYDALTSAWAEVGSGGVGSVDIMFVQDFESASLATFVSPTDVTLSTTDPLHGKVSALLTHDASVNKSFKQIIPVDRKFRGQAMVLDLNVKSAASAGNVTIKITDETGSVDLIASEQLQLSNDVSGRRSSVSFTIPSTCASLSYTITALPEAGSPVTRIDDIVAMLSDVSLLETSVEVPNMTAWQGYTPTFQGFGTGGTGPTNIEFEWRQVGENVEIRGKFTSGTPTAVEARVGLPNGLTSAGTSLIPSTSIFGRAERNITTATSSKDYTIICGPSQQHLNFSIVEDRLTFNPNTPQLGNAIIGNGEILTLRASVPCAGLSATSTKTIPLTQSALVQEADSMIRLVGQNGYGSTNTKIQRFTTIISSIGSTIRYEDSAILGASFTLLESGIYDINFSYDSVTGITHGLSVNTTQPTTNIQSVTDNSRLSYTANTNGLSGTVSYSGYFNANDIIRAHGNGGAIANIYNFSITRQGSLKQLNVSSDQKITIPTSELRFEGASSRGSVATAIVKFDTLAKIRGDAFTVVNTAADGTYVQMNKAGRLSVNTSVFKTTASMYIAISRNQSNLTNNPTSSETLNASGSSSATSQTVSSSWTGEVAVGDIIRVYASATPNTTSDNTLNLSFQEQDISVSVTNTLPQFSESDSFVAVNTTIARGSTYSNIPRFSNLTSNIGTDIVYLDSITDGASFTAMQPGLYNISFTYESPLGGQQRIGITRNLNIASKGTTSVDFLLPSDGLISMCADAPTAGDVNTQSTSVQYYLNAGDIIRGHLQTPNAPANTAHSLFTISKVGKPNVTGVDVTPFVNVPQPLVQSIYRTYTGGGFTGVISGPLTSNTNNGVLAYNATTGIFTAIKACTVDASFSGQNAAAVFMSVNIYKNGAYLVSSDTPNTAGANATTSANMQLAVGETFNFQVGGGTNNLGRFTVTATALSDQILTAPETFSTDTAALSYASSAAYTLSTLQNAPVGTYITFTYAANTNTRTQTTTRPTQTDADMNANGIRLFTRAYNAASTAGNPSIVAIQIGKGLKGVAKSLYNGTGKSVAGNMDLLVVASDAQQSGFFHQDYSETTGILLLDCGKTRASTVTTYLLYYSDTNQATDGYVVINASKNVSLTGMNIERVSARAVQSSGQSIPNTGINLITWDSIKTFDTHGGLNTSTGVYTAPETGYYSVNAMVAFNTAVYAVGNYLRANIYKNGSIITLGTVNVADSTTNTGRGCFVFDIIYLAKGDYIDIRVENNRTAGATTLTTNSGQNFLAIAKTNIGGRN